MDLCAHSVFHKCPYFYLLGDYHQKLNRMLSSATPRLQKLNIVLASLTSLCSPTSSKLKAISLGGSGKTNKETEQHNIPLLSSLKSQVCHGLLFPNHIHTQIRSLGVLRTQTSWGRWHPLSHTPTIVQNVLYISNQSKSHLKYQPSQPKYQTQTWKVRQINENCISKAFLHTEM